MPDKTELVQVCPYCLLCINHQCSRERLVLNSSSWDDKLQCLSYETVRGGTGMREGTFILLGITIYWKYKKYPVESVKLSASTGNVPGWSLGGAQAERASAGPAGASSSSQTKAPAGAGCSSPGLVQQMAQLMSPVSWKVNSSGAQVSSWLTAKSLGSRCTLFNTGKLQASLGSSGAYPSRAMVGRALHSPVLLLHMWAGPRLTYSNPCNSAQKLLYFFLTNIIRLGQNFKTLY